MQRPHLPSGQSASVGSAWRLQDRHALMTGRTTRNADRPILLLGCRRWSDGGFRLM
jgi:hypothetical protein